MPLLFYTRIYKSDEWKEVRHMKIKKEKRLRLSAYDKKKFFEKFKTGLIIVLCLLCAVLTYSVTRLGSTDDGLPAFSLSSVGLGAESSEFTSENALTTFSGLSEPELILIGRDNVRYILGAENPGYAKTVEAVNRVINSLHSSDTVYTRLENTAETKRLLSAAQFYVKYPCERSVSFDAQFNGIKDSPMLKNLAVYSQMFIAAQSTGSITAYIPDTDGKIVKAECVAASSAFGEVLGDIANFTGTPCSFAYEFSGDAGRQFRTALSPMLVIPKAPLAAAAIKCGVPWNFAHGLNLIRNTEFSNELLNIFNFNPNTIRQYTDKNGALVFVGDGGTLSVSPGGIIDYKALAAADSAKSGSTDIYTPTAEFMSITDKVFRLCDINLSAADFSLKFTAVPAMSIDNSDVFLGLDYYVDGNKVETADGYAIDAEISGGTVTRLKICVRNIEKTDTHTESGAFADAVDAFCNENPKTVIITGGSLVYDARNADGTEKNASWKIMGE